MKRRSRADLLADAQRQFRVVLSRSQLLDMGLIHIDLLDHIAKGAATFDTLRDWVSTSLTWSRVAEMLGVGEAEMKEQLELSLRLIERFNRTGRVAFDGPDYQLAKLGVQVMDELAANVDKPTAIAAVRWSEAQLVAIFAANPAHERTPA